MESIVNLENKINNNFVIDIYKTQIPKYFIITVFIAPLCLNMVALKLPIDVVLLNYIFVLMLILTNIFHSRLRNNKVINFFKLVCLLYILIGIINVIRNGEGYMTFLARQYGIFVAIGIVGLFERIPQNKLSKFINMFGNFASIMFLFQLLFSVYESLVAKNFLVDSYDWNTTKAIFFQAASSLSNRLQINYFFSNLNIPFNITFNGILGQHNHWGTQLPFYFLLFGYLYYLSDKRKKRFLFLMLLVSISSVLNTSRFAIFAIFLTGIVFFLIFSSFSSWLKTIIFFTILFLILIFINDIFYTINTYISKTDTFSDRIEVWAVLENFIFVRGIISLLLGSTFYSIHLMRQYLIWADFENLGFTLIFYSGIPFTILFISFLGNILHNVKLLEKKEKVLGWLLVFNIIMVSIWSDVIFRYSSFGLVAVILCGVFLPMEQGDLILMKEQRR